MDLQPDLVYTVLQLPNGEEKMAAHLGIFAGSYAEVIAKFSWLGGLPILLTHGALPARFACLSSATIVYVMVSLYFCFY